MAIKMASPSRLNTPKSSRIGIHSCSVVGEMSTVTSSDLSEQEEEKKPLVQSGQHINIKVTNQEDIAVFFRIKRSTQLKVLMNAYCDKQSVDLDSVRFLFDNRRLKGHRTPDQLEMEDGDEIQAFLDQDGGAIA